MTTQIKTIISLTAMAGLLASSTVSEAAAPKWPKPVKGIKVFSLPEDQVVPTNGLACFVVVAERAKTSYAPLTYQWQRNGSNIFAATEPSLVISNVQLYDVGFFTCVVRRGTNGPSVTVKGVECDAPGARLFVYTGTNTAVTGPYQPGTGTKPCVSNYLGKVTFKVPGTQTTWFSRPSGTTQCMITDTTSLSPPYASKVQVVNTYLWSTCAVNTVTFPTEPPPNYKYQFTTYVTAGAPPLGTGLALDIQWLP
jgi:hypothetical protein